MTTIFWLAVAVFVFCVLYFGWERTSGWLSRRRADAEGVADTVSSKYDQLESKFRAEWTDADVYVSRSRNLWPSLKSNPFFWGGVGTSLMICVLGFMGANALSQGVVGLFALYCLAFICANLIQAAVAVLGDHGRGEWYEFRRGDRPTWHWPILVALLFVNFIANLSGSTNVTEALNTTSEINVSSYQSKKEELRRAEADLDRLRTARLQQAPGDNLEALQAKATELEQKAEREKARGGCGPKCEAIKADAVKWRAIANNALDEQRLEEKIAVMRAAMSSSAADGTARNVASPHAELVETATGGNITKKQVNTYLSPIFWMLIAIVDLALWLWAGDYAGRYRMEQYKIRAEAANAWLEGAGLPPRYKITDEGIVEDVKAIEDKTGGDNIHIDLSESARAKIEKSDRLTQIDNLFNGVMIVADGSKIAIGRAYEIFARIRQEQGEKQHMNPSDFRSAITDYCEIIGIELISNQIIGYKIGVAQHAETVEAAE